MEIHWKRRGRATFYRNFSAGGASPYSLLAVLLDVGSGGGQAENPALRIFRTGVPPLDGDWADVCLRCLPFVWLPPPLYGTVPTHYTAGTQRISGFVLGGVEVFSNGISSKSKIQRREERDNVLLSCLLSSSLRSMYS